MPTAHSGTVTASAQGSNPVVPSPVSFSAHSADKSASNCKMGDVIKVTLNVAGLLTNVHQRSNHSNSSEPIVVLFFLHGRGENADSVDPTARAAFAWVDKKQASSSKRSLPPRDFIVVTFVRGFLRSVCLSGWLAASCPRR